MKYWVLMLLLGCFTTLSAQKPVQVIRGKVFDQISGNPLSNAQIILKDTSPLIGTTTDKEGKFEIQGVPVGRYVILIKFLGFKSFSEEVILKGSKSSVIEAALLPSFDQLEEVVIKDQPFMTDPTDIGKRSVTIEQTRRFAANYLDPARVMIGFPGVVPQNDQNNNLIINGKSPNGLLWRLQGLDIVNPNHLANAGTLNDRPTQNGGGVNILSTQMLEKTSFLTPSFSSDYGNATSGVMDMHLRAGDKYKTHYTLQASVIGLDIAAEGPLATEKSSFLINYRYSTVGLLSGLGLDFGGEEINYQDFAVHLNFDQSKGKKLSVFGFGGHSKNDFRSPEDPSEWDFDKDSTNIDYSSYTSALGFDENIPLSVNTSLNIGSVLSFLDNDRASKAISNQGNLSPAENYQAEKLMVSSKLEIKSRVHSKITLTSGIMVNFLKNELLVEEPYRYENALIDGKIESFLFQPHVSFNMTLAPDLTLDGGIRYMYLGFNNTKAWLPQVSLGYKLNKENNIILEYGNQAQVQLDQTYLSDSNKDLKMNKMRHLALGYHHFFDRSIASAELFYEHQYDIAVDQNPNAFSLINGLNDVNTTSLSNNGMGNIHGIHMTWEQPMYQGLYYLISGSYYNATYTGSDGKKRDSRFNGKYTFSLTAGKEIDKEKKGGNLRVIGLNGRVYYAGGMRTTPIFIEESRNNGTTIYDQDHAFDNKLKDYFRVDFRISLRKEKMAYTRVFAIDLQNVLFIENEGARYYDFRKGRVINKKQLGIIPVLLYRIEF